MTNLIRNYEFLRIFQKMYFFLMEQIEQGLRKYGH